VSGYSPKCDNTRCPVCYPNWKEEEEAARKRAEDDREDCLRCWRNLQKQAEKIASAGDPVLRNRAINAAYAQLWWDERRFQWAGLAAFASKQVGCGLLNAAEMIQKSNRQREAYQRWDRNASALERMSPYGSPRMPLPDQVMGRRGEGLPDARVGQYGTLPRNLAVAQVLRGVRSEGSCTAIRFAKASLKVRIGRSETRSSSGGNGPR
jgi:hypothetical protein